MKLLEFEFKRDVNDESQNELFDKFSAGEPVELVASSYVNGDFQQINDKYYIYKIEYNDYSNSYKVFMST